MVAITITGSYFIGFKYYIFFQVQWVQQQHEKKRLKRDYQDQYRGYPWHAAPGPAVVTAPLHRTRYRALAAQNIFPDPLFKEQWYLVSILNL